MVWQHDMDEDDFARQWVKGALRSEMVKRGITYAELGQRLSRYFHHIQDERVLRNKAARGTFNAAFFVQCLAAMGCKSLPIDLLESRAQADNEIDRELGMKPYPFKPDLP